MVRKITSNREVQIPILLVQIGPIPRYLEKNLKYLATTFPGKRKCLITDQENITWIEKLGIEVFRSEYLIQNWPEEFTITDRRRYFRNNFWFSTKARLLLLPKFMRSEGLDKILHLENDVWIHPHFPFHVFEDLKYDLAFPRVDDRRGIASTVFVNGQGGIQILERACLKWPKFTDMEILGNILASEENVLELASTYGHTDESLDGWIFDGAKLGMFLFGSDAKNSKGIIKRFSRSPMGDLGASERITIERDRLVLGRAKVELMIASLHIHSKNLGMFSNNWQRRLEYQLLRERFNLSYGFDLNAFFDSMAELVQRISRKLRLMA